MKTPSHFMLSAMAPHGREMSQDLRKKIISLHKKEEGYKKISKALLISQNTVAKVVQTFKKDGTATISQRRPGRPWKLTPRQERLLMRRVEENRHASSLQLSKEVESQTGVTISRDTIWRTLQRKGMCVNIMTWSVILSLSGSACMTNSHSGKLSVIAHVTPIIYAASPQSSNLILEPILSTHTHTHTSTSVFTCHCLQLSIIPYSCDCHVCLPCFCRSGIIHRHELLSF